MSALQPERIQRPYIPSAVKQLHMNVSELAHFLVHNRIVGRHAASYVCESFLFAALAQVRGSVPSKSIL